MTAPKPRVWQVEPPFTRYISARSGSTAYQLRAVWAWTCECMEHKGKPVRTDRYEYVLQAAYQHSLTHTAKRVADYLNQQHRDLLDDLNEDAHSVMSRSYRYGMADAFLDAANLVRKHLVRG